MASPAELAEVVAADAISLADARMVTVGVTDLADAGATPLADAGIPFPAEPAGAVTIGVASFADVRMVTIGAVMVWTLVMLIEYRLESGVERGLQFGMTCMISLLVR